MIYMLVGTLNPHSLTHCLVLIIIHFPLQLVVQGDSVLFLSHVKISTMIVQTIFANVILDMLMMMESASKVIYLKRMDSSFLRK